MRASAGTDQELPMTHDPQPTNSNSHAAITDDAILNTCFCANLAHGSALPTFSPCNALSPVNNTSAREYEERCYRDTGLSLTSAHVLQPHVYKLATRMYLLMQ